MQSILGHLIEGWLTELRQAQRSPATLEAYGNDMRHVLNGLTRAHSLDATELTAEHLTRTEIIDVFDQMQTTGYSPASVRRAMATLGSFCKHLRAIGEMTINPMEAILRPPLPPRRPRLIQADDYPRRLLDVAAQPDRRRRMFWPKRDVAMIATYLTLGLRESEALAIRLNDIAIESSKVTVLIHGKRNKERVLPVPSELYRLWGIYIGERNRRFPDRTDNDPLFLHARSGTPLTRQQVQNMMDVLYRKAGIRDAIPPGALVHSLRHGFATQAVRAGADLVELRDILGHENIAVTNIYLHSDPERLRDLVAEHPIIGIIGAA